MAVAFRAQLLLISPQWLVITTTEVPRLGTTIMSTDTSTSKLENRRDWIGRMPIQELDRLRLLMVKIQLVSRRPKLFAITIVVVIAIWVVIAIVEVIGTSLR